MPSLPELQRRFASALLDTTEDPHAGLAIYRNTVFANYRNALAATYRVVRALTGAPFFAEAVDTYALAHPSTGGDLNVYGGEFADFLAAYPHARELPYLPDVARLEWAIDDAHRAADAAGSAEATLAALATIPAADVALQRFTLDPSCRLLRSPFPVLRIWQVHQADFAGNPRVDFDGATDFLAVRREAGAVVVERLPRGDFAWLAALHGGADLALALDAAQAADPMFDLGTALRAHLANGTLAGLAGR